MMKTLILVFAALGIFAGCASHQSNSNAVMMDKVVGELDRETAK